MAIIGFGRIGQLYVGRMLQEPGHERSLPIIRSAAAKVWRAGRGTVIDLDTALAEGDVISVHA